MIVKEVMKNERKERIRNYNHSFSLLVQRSFRHICHWTGWFLIYSLCKHCCLVPARVWFTYLLIYLFIYLFIHGLPMGLSRVHYHVTSGFYLRWILIILFDCSLYLFCISAFLPDKGTSAFFHCNLLTMCFCHSSRANKTKEAVGDTSVCLSHEVLGHKALITLMVCCEQTNQPYFLH